MCIQRFFTHAKMSGARLPAGVLVGGTIVAFYIWLGDDGASPPPALPTAASPPPIRQYSVGAAADTLSRKLLSQSLLPAPQQGARFSHGRVESRHPQPTSDLRRDLIFGVVAFSPANCAGNVHKNVRKKCDRSAYNEGVHRWVRSVRMATDASRTDVLLFTGRGQGSLLADAKVSAWLAAADVQVVEAKRETSNETRRALLGPCKHMFLTRFLHAPIVATTRQQVVEADYEDTASRVGHGDASRFVWCVMRNRWFVISRHLEPIVHR